MSAQPMLDAKEMEVPIARAMLEGAGGVTVPTEEQLSKYDAKATSLRRACAALLFFSILCSRPWPSAGWIGQVAGLLVLCSSSQKLLCRARAARFLSAVVAIFASIAVVTLVTSIYANKPQKISAAISSRCVSMPADTFQWARTIISEHECAQKGLAFLSRHVHHHKDADTVVDTVALSNATDPAMLVAWSQPEACNTIARVSTCVVKMVMIGSVIAHLLLLLSAATVVKRACCLRCAAYKCGFLKMSCGACKCKDAPKPAPTAMATAKELA